MASIITRLVRHPRSLLQILTQPTTAVQRIRYFVLQPRHFSQSVSEHISAITGKSSFEVDAALENLRAHHDLLTHIDRVRSTYAPRERGAGGIGATDPQEYEALYVLVRLIKPELVVETGVSAGLSSSFILQAMADSSVGQLYSIDLPLEDFPSLYRHRYAIPSRGPSGFAIPQNLRARWHCIIGDARETLVPLLDSIGTIDIFLHDSLHTEQHQLWEYRTAWPFLRSGGYLLSDDAGFALFRFARQQRLVPLRLSHLGTVRKP